MPLPRGHAGAYAVPGWLQRHGQPPVCGSLTAPCWRIALQPTPSTRPALLANRLPSTTAYLSPPQVPGSGSCWRPAVHPAQTAARRPGPKRWADGGEQYYFSKGAWRDVQGASRHLQQAGTPRDPPLPCLKRQGRVLSAVPYLLGLGKSVKCGG